MHWKFKVFFLFHLQKKKFQRIKSWNFTLSSEISAISKAWEIFLCKMILSFSLSLSKPDMLNQPTQLQRQPEIL